MHTSAIVGEAAPPPVSRLRGRFALSGDTSRGTNRGFVAAETAGPSTRTRAVQRVLAQDEGGEESGGLGPDAVPLTMTTSLDHLT
jgi:hypothetical protein